MGKLGLATNNCPAYFPLHYISYRNIMHLTNISHAYSDKNAFKINKTVEGNVPSTFVPVILNPLVSKTQEYATIFNAFINALHIIFLIKHLHYEQHDIIFLKVTGSLKSNFMEIHDSLSSLSLMDRLKSPGFIHPLVSFLFGVPETAKEIFTENREIRKI